MTIHDEPNHHTEIRVQLYALFCIVHVSLSLFFSIQKNQDVRVINTSFVFIIRKSVYISMSYHVMKNNTAPCLFHRESKTIASRLVEREVPS